MLLRLLFLVPLLACATPSTPGVPTAGPYVLVLGTAQDGGLPQIGCRCRQCRRARGNADAARLVTSLLVVDPRSGKRWVIDASPDLPEQVERMHGHPASRRMEGPRPPLFDGVFLTHAHMGHYTGLLSIGFESYGMQDLPVYGTTRMRDYLTNNGPWSFMVETGAIRLEPVEDGVELAPDLVVRVLFVPHREEFTDTVAFLVEGPERTLLYLPDIDKWERWDTPIESVLAEVDFALLDASFFGPEEIRGRDMSEFPHPFIRETLERLAPLPASERAKVRFTHLNHSNPANDPRSAASARIRAAGMRVLADGEVFDLSR